MPFVASWFNLPSAADRCSTVGKGHRTGAGRRGVYQPVQRQGPDRLGRRPAALVRQRRRHPRRDHAPRTPPRATPSSSAKTSPPPTSSCACSSAATPPTTPASSTAPSTSPKAKLANEWVVHGYQGEIRNEIELPSVSGFIYDEGGKRGRLVPRRREGRCGRTARRPSPARPARPSIQKGVQASTTGTTTVIVARGNHIQQFINGVHTVDFTDDEPHLALKERNLRPATPRGKPDVGGVQGRPVEKAGCRRRRGRPPPRSSRRTTARRTSPTRTPRCPRT